MMILWSESEKDKWHGFLTFDFIKDIYCLDALGNLCSTDIYNSDKKV